MLTATDLSKAYPGVRALDGVSLELRAGEVHAIAGENGAGKSTLMRILSGATRPDAGELTLDGEALTMNGPRDAAARGIRMVHQELTLVPGLTVAENVTLGAEPSRRGLLDRRAMIQRAEALLARLAPAPVPRPDAIVGRLPLAARQMVEIAKALAGEPRVLILDEPTTILGAAEQDALLSLVERLRGDGLAIAYISHRLDEIDRLADRVTVLRDGRVVRSAAKAEWTRGAMVRAMVGHDVDAPAPRTATAAPTTEPLLVVDHVAGPGVRDASLSVHAGEIVAVTGLVGSGRTELAKLIFGAAPLRGGRMNFGGAPWRPRSPADAVARGVGLVPEDRKLEALVLHEPVRFNVTLGLVHRWAPRWLVRREAERAAAREWTERLRVKAPSTEVPVRTLSGGNQQKVVLARALLAGARLLVVDEPTRGVDVRAKEEIHQLLRDLASGGTAVIVISSELPEALALADRVVVMREGRSVAELSREEATPEAIGARMLGAA